MSTPGREGEAKLSFNGEVFLLDLPGGYTWAEFGDTDQERTKRSETSWHFWTRMSILEPTRSRCLEATAGRG